MTKSNIKVRITVTTILKITLSLIFLPIYDATITAMKVAIPIMIDSGVKCILYTPVISERY